MSSSTHTADFQTATVKANDLDAVAKINVGLETDQDRKHLNIVADAPEIRIQDKTGSAPEVNATTMAIVADGGATHFRAGTTTFAEGAETKGNVKFQSSTGATTHAEIVGSSGKLELQDGGLGLKLGSNVSVSGTPSAVIQEITGPHARDEAVLKKYPEVPLSSNVQSGYVASASSQYADGNYDIWKAHDGETVFGTAPSYYYSAATQAYSTTDGSYTGATWSTTSSGTAYAGEYVQMQFPTPIKLSHVRIVSPDAGATYNKNSPKQGVICGSNDGTTWTTIAAYSGITYATLGASAIIQAPSNVAYKYIRLVATHIEGVGSTGWFVIEELEYYGYEDVGAGDDSVDTTVKSVYNAPDLTSAALYIDAAKTGTSVTDQSGSTPSVTVTATGVTYDSSEKAWELTGAATSNIVSGDLASLVGDHPHSVSAWVKADQLNGDGLFHVGTAEGEGDAASRVGFVDDSHISWGGEKHYFSNAEWHNVTYTYNGEGSDKKLYLDGRLVDTAKNEDTFGEYPPFAMTNYSEYGYTVSASSELAGGGYKAWEAFDNTTGGTSGGGGAADQAWISANSTYTGSTYHSTKNLGTDHGGSATTSGEYLILELPHKLILSYVEISPRGSDPDRAPRDGKVYGSNDKVNWTEIRSFTGLTHSSGSYASVVVNANSGFKMFAIVTTAILFSNAAAWLGIGELKYYGHRENDLVRFPDPTNVLKYPHISMTGPAQRGYVASASSQYHDGNYPPYNAFNNVFTGSDPTHTWNSKASAYHMSSDGEYNGSDNFSTTISGTAYAGEWIQIELPRKVVASALKLGSYGSNSGRSPRAGAFAGSNDGSSWDLLKTYGGETSWTQGTLKSFAPNNNTTTAYKYFRFVITHVQVSNDGLTALQAFEVHGTESGDVVARVGDGFDGKVRNLRVFSTALSDARVQEIFDADKDEFGLAKSSISVYRARLGVGTAEPKGALTVMDEVGELEEFPPKPMIGYQTYMEGHGLFRVRDSGHYIHANGVLTYPAWYVFNHTIAGAKSWYSLNGTYYNGTDNSYSGTAQMTSSLTLGDYIMLELPYRVKAKAFVLYGPNYQNEYPRDYTFYGSNNGELWTNMLSVTGASVRTWLGTGDRNKHEVDSSTFFKYFAIIITKGSATRNTYVGIDEWRILGTREQGASTLHNGELSLTRNLTVPRIGPPLDADDTPRRDRLVVEYNTTTNPTENGVVKDTSGRGLDGLTYDGATYDATEKALVFDGSNDFVFQNDVGLTSVFSISFWVKLKSKAVALAGIGTYASNQTCTFYISSTQFQVIGYNNDNYWAYDFPLNTWVHACVTYNGGGFTTLGNTRLYINGVEASGTKTTYLGGGATTSTTIAFPSPCNLYMGRMQGGSPNYASCSESNLKLYDVALTADEVKLLYDMGRCDEGSHVVNFSKTRVGIGLGDGEAPQAALDVRGDIYGGCPVYFQALYNANFSATAYNNGSGGALIPWNTLFEHKGDCFDTSTGLFTAPIDGLYRFGYSMRKQNSGYSDFWTYIQKNGVPMNGTANTTGRVYASGASGLATFVSQTFILDLSAGDTIGILLAESDASGIDARISNSYNYFHGYYVGTGNGSFGSYSY